MKTLYHFPITNKASFRKVIVVFVALFTICSVTSIAQTTELHLASDIWPPFTDVKGEKSIAIDLVSEAISRIDIKPNVEILDFKVVLPGVITGKYDGSSAMWITDERKENMLFSKPYLNNQLIIVGRKGSDVSASSMDDLKGKRIGIVDNYAYGLNSDDYILISEESDQKNLSRLLSNEIDYMLVDAILIQYLVQYQLNDVTEFLEIGSKPLMVKPLHFVLNKNVKNADQIIASFDKEIEKMIADGTYNRILEFNWISADIDGDGKMELILQGNKAGTKAPDQAYSIHANNTLAKSQSERYHIEGQTYYGWDSVPQQYKTDIVMGSQNLKNSGIRLNFK